MCVCEFGNRLLPFHSIGNSHILISFLFVSFTQDPRPTQLADSSLKSTQLQQQRSATTTNNSSTATSLSSSRPHSTLAHPHLPSTFLHSSSSSTVLPTVSREKIDAGASGSGISTAFSTAQKGSTVSAAALKGRGDAGAGGPGNSIAFSTAQKGRGEASGSGGSTEPLPIKVYDVLDVRAGVRRLEGHAQRLASTRARRERARERLYQVFILRVQSVHKCACMYVVCCLCMQGACTQTAAVSHTSVIPVCGSVCTFFFFSLTAAAHAGSRQK